MTAALSDLPPRLTTSEVCALARVSITTFHRRRRSGEFPVQPIDRGSEMLFPRDATLRALGMLNDDAQDSTPDTAPTWDNPDPDAIRNARSRKIRQRPRPESGRDVSRPVRSAGKAPALRLAFDATASD